MLLDQPDFGDPSGGDRRGDDFWHRNALSLACFAFFAVFLVAQSLTGWRTAVADAVQHGEAGFSYWTYLTTGHFAEATFENWESEFLQMGAFVLLTVFLSSAAQASPSRSATTRGTKTHATTAATPERRGRCAAAESG